MKKLLSVVVMLTFILVPAGNILACSNPGQSKVNISCPTNVRINSCIKQYSGTAKTSFSLPVIKINGVPLAKEYISGNSCKSPVKVKPSDKPKTPVSKPKAPAPSKPKKPVTPAPQPQPPSNPVPDPKPGNEDSFNPSSMQSEMLAYINAERAKAKLSPLVLDEKLCQGAYLKSKDIAVNNYFSHNSPTYGSPFDMMKDLGIAYRLAGENIAKNTSVKGAHQAFMNSSGHRANILNSGFKKLGLGFYQSGSYLYVTQWFTN
ncbi:MAG: CAP domain-containing protein [Syntrophomonadaceae bacterium]|jgi:uncharacterized YkwD family protein